MKFDTIQIIALIVIAITVIKLAFMLFKRNSFDSFFESYKSSVTKNPWLYFSIYLFISILTLYFIRANTDTSYTQIVAVCMFLSFLLNAALIGTDLLKHYDLSKINWTMVGIYILIWFFIMFKSIQEIFNF